MNIKRLEMVLDNYINGNITDFRRNLKNMTKRDIVQFHDMLTEFIMAHPRADSTGREGAVATETILRFLE